MQSTLRLVDFALPPTFPPELVPKPLAQFVANCVPGLTKQQLIVRTSKCGWRPKWSAIPHLDRNGIEVYGFALTVDGVGVPLIVRMRRGQKAERPPKVPEKDPRQIDLPPSIGPMGF
ncbi:hypothetical protein [Burkholderia multivorans]|uniref:hypothetical protein n=1 Tax=Burkholderia multivorans TaxID=87883 RepID=UPI0012FD9176|nr:hypothetical protein [Burkholderia multivorans]